MKTVEDFLKMAAGEVERIEMALRGKLDNKNLPDVIAVAKRQLLQAASHADAATEIASLEPEPPAPAEPQPIPAPGGLPFAQS